jgi:large subunit ribosomal protein L4
MYYMPKVAVYNIAGDQTGELELNDNVFNVEVLDAVLHQAVVMQQANQRQGNASTKTRGFVRGGGRKPWKQKGTGRARAGSTRSPIWVGGGITFGPHPRSYAFAMPKKARRLAIKGALTVKLQDAELIVLDALDFAEPKTQNTLSLLKNLKSDKKTLIITAEQDENVAKSSRNIPGVKTITSLGLNVVDLLYHDKVFVTKGAVAKIEEVLG